MHLATTQSRRAQLFLIGDYCIKHIFAMQCFYNLTRLWNKMFKQKIMIQNVNSSRLFVNCWLIFVWSGAETVVDSMLIKHSKLSRTLYSISLKFSIRQAFQDFYSLCNNLYCTKAFLVKPQKQGQVLIKFSFK